MVRLSNVNGGDDATAHSNTFNPRKQRSFLFTLLISFATFNIRGLGSQHDDSQHSKRELLGMDCKSYQIDICAVQMSVC